MKVRLTTMRVARGLTQRPDDVIEVADDEGKRLIAAGSAEPVDEADPGLSQQQLGTRPETAATEPPRNAAKPSGRFRKAIK